MVTGDTTLDRVRTDTSMLYRIERSPREGGRDNGAFNGSVAYRHYITDV